VIRVYGQQQASSSTRSALSRIKEQRRLMTEQRRVIELMRKRARAATPTGLRSRLSELERELEERRRGAPGGTA
jgi:hypothetical protein